MATGDPHEMPTDVDPSLSRWITDALEKAEARGVAEERSRVVAYLDRYRDWLRGEVEMTKDEGARHELGVAGGGAP